MKVFDGLYAFIWDDNRENNCNTYLIDADKKILIDPGHKHLAPKLLKHLSSLKITPDKIDLIIITHVHPDHIEAADLFKKPTLMAMGETEYKIFKQFGASFFKIPEPDILLKPGELKIGSVNIDVIETPGHSPGSICLYWKDKKALFTGDVVFSQGIGRTDLPGGNGSQLKESILKLKELDADYLLSGHGEIVAGRENVKRNFKMIEEYWFNYL